MFLKLKQESSGYSYCVHTEEHKDIEDYWRAEGIDLEKASIFQNGGATYFGKVNIELPLGKSPQNQKKAQTSLITSESFTVLVLQTSYSRKMTWHG